MEPNIEVNALAVRRGQAHLLAEVTWQCRPGEHWVILGPNGCGKTSLLKVLLGYLTPSQGQLKVLGHTYGAADWRTVRRELGIVSSALQAHIPDAEPALETVISGRYAQLDFWGRATRADISLARQTLAELDAAALAERPWAWLSQGERQRVLIARALVARPQLLILDEPCAGLDPVARADFLRSIEALALRRESPGLVLVTHHVEEITPSFSHVLLMARGRVVASGATGEVLRSETLSRAFARPVRLTKSRSGWSLRVEAADAPVAADDQVAKSPAM